MGWPERVDIIKWINRILLWEPNARIVLHGVSMGAATVLMASGEDLPGNVKAVIADCGYTSEWDEFQREADTLHIPWFPVLNATSVLSKIRDGYDFKQASALAQVKRAAYQRCLFTARRMSLCRTVCWANCMRLQPAKKRNLP